MKTASQGPSFALRDLAGLVTALVITVALVVIAFLTHAGPFILLGILILLTFGLLRRFRERGRETEAQEIAKALRTRLRKGEILLAYTIGDRRRAKPLTTLMDYLLALFTQGLAAEGTPSMTVDDTLVGLTDHRLIALDRQKRLPGQKRDWLDRFHLRRLENNQGKHAILFDTPMDGATASVRLAVFYLARLRVQTATGETFSIGLNSRYWAERAVELTQQVRHQTSK
jgi:hypothetical protein